MFPYARVQENGRIPNTPVMGSSGEYLSDKSDLRLSGHNATKATPSLEESAHTDSPRASVPVKTATTSKRVGRPAKKVGKKKKRPNTKKRPLTAYNIFFREQRDHVSSLRRQIPPGQDCPSIAKIISDQWKALTRPQRAHYDALAAEEKLREYNKNQGWIDYSRNEPALQDEVGPAAAPTTADDRILEHRVHARPSMAAPQASYNDDPWPLNATEDIANRLDPESIDLIIRTFGH